MRIKACIEQERLFPRQLKRVYKNSETPTNQWVEIPPNLTTICLDLRSSINGSADPWETNFLREVVNMLKMRSNEWYPSKDDIDQFVYCIVQSAIFLGEEELRKRDTTSNLL